MGREGSETGILGGGPRDRMGREGRDGKARGLQMRRGLRNQDMGGSGPVGGRCAGWGWGRALRGPGRGLEDRRQREWVGVMGLRGLPWKVGVVGGVPGRVGA